MSAPSSLTSGGAPEHKSPAQIDDVENAYRWLLAQNVRPEGIASIGHSIGGNSVTLRDKSVPLPAAILAHPGTTWR